MELGSPSTTNEQTNTANTDWVKSVDLIVAENRKKAIAAEPYYVEYISAAFQDLDGLEYGLPSDVLEHFAIDDSVGRISAPTTSTELIDLLSNEPTTGYYPPEAIRNSLPRQADYFRYTKSPFGGKGIVAKRAVPKGTNFCYEGRTQRRDETNEYTLAIQAVSSVGGRPDQVAYIDGTPSDVSLLGGMNEYIWDRSVNQFQFDAQGVVDTPRNIVRNEECYMYYGENFNWDKYKLSLVQELVKTVMEGVGLFGHPSYLKNATDLIENILTWSATSLPFKRLGTGVERLLMAVVDDVVPKNLIHSVYPSHLGGNVPEPFGRWLERFLCSGVIINRTAFRKAHDPRVLPCTLAECMEATAPGERVYFPLVVFCLWWCSEF